ncbi:hypothetical protein CPB84DRAFT_1778767 [Gymnopilus junonius]|uniref:F-box domain-containing protein n=1 Tax=Gymnopilus junonius TaxID=109634 RepID=A0A9P5TN30_GYMJU|nr:hypothetical protein CPB84DRAFT_1778767 [Gymnopilus junonius]
MSSKSTPSSGFQMPDSDLTGDCLSSGTVQPSFLRLSYLILKPSQDSSVAWQPDRRLSGLRLPSDFIHLTGAKEMAAERVNASYDKLAALLKRQEEQEDERNILLKKIEELTIKVASLNNSIAATKLEYLRMHNAEIPVVLNLPPEITHLIFFHASRNESLAEIKLSHICHEWRRLALGFPDMWSRIILTFSDKTHREQTSHRRRFLAYLERSRSWPLVLRFEIYSLAWCNGLAPMLLNFMKIAGKHALRWRRFSLEMIPPKPLFGVDWDNKDLLMVLHQLSTPVLELFEVILPSSPHLVPERNNGNLRRSFGGFPSKLALVRMDSLSFMRCTPPLDNITTLRLENRVDLRVQLAFRVFLELVNSTPSLVNLMIGKGVFDSNFAAPSSMRKASAKRLKNFLCVDQSVGENMWLWVDAPVLELLIFREIWFDPFVEYMKAAVDNKTPITHFPSLKTLALMDCVFDTPDDDFPLAHATRGMSHLYVYGGRLSVSRDRFLVPRVVELNSTTLFWPNMQTFACSLSEQGEPSERDYESYLQQVQSRSILLPTPCRLQLSRADAERWASAHPESWEALQSGGHFEEKSIDPRRSSEDVLECTPWPLSNFRDFWDQS